MPHSIMRGESQTPAVSYRDLFPVKLTWGVAVLLGTILNFALGYSFGLGLIYGLAVSTLVSFISFRAYRDLGAQLRGGTEGTSSDRIDGGRRNKIVRRFRLGALTKFVIYGGGLVLTTFLSPLNLYAAIGGLLLPRFSLQLRALVRTDFLKDHFGG